MSDDDYIINVNSKDGSVGRIMIDAWVCETSFESYVDKERVDTLVPKSRRLFEAVDSFVQLANACQILLVTGWLIDVDVSIDLAIEEGGLDIHLVYFHVEGRANGEYGSEGCKLEDR